VASDISDYPLLAEESLKEIGSQILSHITSGPCVFVLGLPFSGRSTLLRQLVNKPELVGGVFSQEIREFMWCVVDLPAEESLVNYITQSSQFRTKHSDIDIAGKTFMQLVEWLVKEKGENIGFVINSLDSADGEKRREILLAILGAYYQFPNKVKLIFGQGCEEVDANKENLRELYPHLGEKLVWIPLMNKNDIDNFLDVYIKVTGRDISGIDRGKFYELTGGFLPLMKRCLDKPEMLAGVENFASDPINIHAFDALWGSLAEETQEQLLVFSRGRKIDDFSAYAVETRLIKKTEGGWQFFSPAFQYWVRKIADKIGVSMEERENELFLGKERIMDILTAQEYQVLKKLWDNRGSVVERSSISHAMWGPEAETKYSDWAIDQVISKLRRKLGDQGENKMIKTIKGKGLILQT
jgi:hypothetical protein